MKRFFSPLIVLLAVFIVSACDSLGNDSARDEPTPVVVVHPTRTAPPSLPTGTQQAIVPTSASTAQQASVATSLPQATVLTAGEIDDNDQWGHYLDYRNDYLQADSYSVHDVNVSKRYVITVSDGQGLPVLGARVSVFDGQTEIAQSRTYATGKTLFFPLVWSSVENEQGYRVVVQKADQATEFTLYPQDGTDVHVELDPQQQSDSTKLDVLFLLDTTGSMGDEIEQLQLNILSISDQISQLRGNVDVHYGLVLYRDRGDDYVTRQYDFVSDVKEFQSTLLSVGANGGGDKPESLNEGLHVAIQKVDWRGDDTVKLVFLVADAPPHLDYANDYDYTKEMVAAAGEGIKIHSIASSGLPQDGEFIFRQISQYTMGHFLFLAYQNGSSGDAGSERTDIEAAEGENYTVEQLDELVLKLIKDEIAALDIPVDQNGDTQQVSMIAPLPDTKPPQPPEFTQAKVDSSSVVSSSPLSERDRSTADGAPDVSFSVSLPMMLAVGIVLFVAGYWLSTNGVGRRKRKNDEIYFEQ